MGWTEACNLGAVLDETLREGLPRGGDLNEVGGTGCVAAHGEGHSTRAAMNLALLRNRQNSMQPF